jgi:hypothetical protein
MVHLITLGARYEKISVRLTVSPEHAYGFPAVADSHRFDTNEIYELQSDDLAEREEMDISVGYSMFDSFSYGFLKTQWRKTETGEVNDYTL